ncbi:MAG TPA: serine hydrolase domain-containing protein [bacterium]|nr:serine hydrolase domain-containing protein [bacterium]
MTSAPNGPIDRQMDEAVREGVFPGAALLVAKGNQVLHRAFYGNAALLPSPEPATETTLWDIASLTKPVATASLALVSMKEKGLSLSSHAARYLPLLDAEDKKKITIRHLLKHTSGLPAWRPYFEDVARERPELVGRRESRGVYLEKIAREPLDAAVSYKKIYSDLGFILLGILLEDFWGKGLDQLFEEKVAGPLGMRNTFYLPVRAKGEHEVSGSSPVVRGRPYTQFAATEDSAWRKKIIRGEVHDDNAYTLGGVAGHAGLFSNVDDLHRFLLAIREARGGAKKNDAKLGWDTPDAENSQAGKYFSKNSIGHLGYSGCSMWMDRDQDFHVILLTNRVHPSSKNEAIKQFRPRIHDFLYEQLIQR